MEYKTLRMTQETHDYLWMLKRQHRLASLEAAILYMRDQVENEKKMNVFLNEQLEKNSQRVF